LEPPPCEPSHRELCEELKSAEHAAVRATGCQTITAEEITFVGEDPEVVFDLVATSTANACNIDPDFAPAAVGYATPRVPQAVVKLVPLPTDDGNFVDPDQVFAIATLRLCFP
jgi:hypothetical protein